MPLLTARFKRPRLLIVGCGDVGWRVLRLLGSTWSVRVLTRSVERFVALLAGSAFSGRGQPRRGTFQHDTAESLGVVQGQIERQTAAHRIAEQVNLCQT